MVDRVLVAVDGSPSAGTALEHAIERYADAEVIVVHVLNPIEEVPVTDPAFWDRDRLERMERDGESLLEDARRLASGRGVSVATHLEHGPTVTAILNAADRFDVDLIVIGSRGRTGLDRLLLGSVAAGVVRRARVPVTVVR